MLLGTEYFSNLNPTLAMEYITGCENAAEDGFEPFVPAGFSVALRFETVAKKIVSPKCPRGSANS